MNYQTFEPTSDLEEWVKCYWILESLNDNIPAPITQDSKRQTIIPDGCMEMIFHYGDLYKQYIESGESILQPKCFVIGQLTTPLEIEPTGTTGIFSVRFHPEGFMPFATIPLREMENKAVSLEHLFGASGQALEAAVLTAQTTAERIRLVEVFLINKLADNTTIDRIVQSTVETILTANGQLSIEALSRQTGINRRQLERKFASAIGLSPKQLSKTIRLQATLKMLLNKQFTSLTALAYQGEYYDQAHFIKDFKEFTGLTPKEFYHENLEMSSLFYGTD
jgi:AraC-like DNA-binding protein